MRLLGNKRRLLGDIEKFLRDKGVSGGTFIDIFCGTGKVGKHFKGRGFRVLANDRLSMCFTKAVAEIEANGYPAFRALREKYAKVLSSRSFQRAPWRQATFAFAPDEPARGRRPGRETEPLAEVLRLLTTHVEPEEGLIFRNFSPGGRHGRMYFSDQNGKRIDGILRFIRENHRQEKLSRHELHLLLSALLDAADRVANISGTYGAYLKRVQPNALSPIRLRLPEITASAMRHRAFQRDANELVREIEGDVLYIDPPYNTRQYAANYHILEIIAELHAVEDLDAYEEKLYGKTGLRPYEDLKSLYCIPRSRASKRGGDVLTAMTDLVLSSHARHVLISYNEEGLLSREELGGILALFQGSSSFDHENGMREVLHRRFRSDSDRSPGKSGGGRRYKVLEGKERDKISEWLLFASRRASRRRARKRTPAAAAGTP